MGFFVETAKQFLLYYLTSHFSSLTSCAHQVNAQVKSPASGASNSHGVTGGVYKARERIHRDILIRDY